MPSQAATRFSVRSTSGHEMLEFFERTPVDRERTIERFKVRIEQDDLSAVSRVYAGAIGEHPLSFFERMASHWRGWEGAFAWESSGGELILCATQDRAGRVTIRVDLRSGPSENDWSVSIAMTLGAGQLEDLARDACDFFEGKPTHQVVVV